MVTVLITTTILLMLVTALLISSRGRLSATRSIGNSVASLYVAEAGLADAMAALENAPTWPGAVDQKVGDGSWSIWFGTAPAPNLASVNNLDGNVAADSWRGPGTVPPHSVLIIVSAQVSGVPRVLEALVRKGTAGMTVASAIQTTGNVTMNGDVKVDGIKDLKDATAVPAGIHSTNTTAAANIILWDGLGTANISGNVSTVSSDVKAINMTGATVGMGTQTSVAAQTFPATDILGTISSKSSKPAPTINSSGVTRLPSGELYHDGDLEVNGGDLVLNATKLYVRGKLKVNGTIKGTGSLYVANETVFQGDASLTASATDSLSLLSHGSVTLTGFKGTEYLNELASTDPVAAAAWSETRSALKNLQQIMDESAVTDLVAGGPRYEEVEAWRRALGQSDETAGGVPPPGFGYNNLRVLQKRVAAQEPSEAQAFMSKKLDELDRFFDGKTCLDDMNGGQTDPDSDLRDDWEAGGSKYYGGWFDACFDSGFTSTAKEMVVLTQQIDWNKLGTSYFRGTIYTRGSLLADNEVNVLGAIVAQGDASQPTRTAPDGRTLPPGSLWLGKGSRVTFVETMSTSLSAIGPGDLRVWAWLGR